MKEDTYSRILDNIHDGLYFVDTSRKITFWNKSAERISGYSYEEVVGKSCADSILTHMDCEGNLLCKQGCPLMATIEDGQLRQSTVYMHHKDGHRIPVSVRVSPLLDEHGTIIGGIEIFTDVSSFEGNELRVQELQKMALLDNLTNLANRRYLEQELENRFAEYKRFGVPFGVLFMDIDHFKQFNDTYGHCVGDKVLQLIARTFIANSRPFDLYGRWGGEEFLGIIRNVRSEQIIDIGERIRILIEGSYLTEGSVTEGSDRLLVTLSVGATMVEEGDCRETLIERADRNLYQSKETGRNRLTFS